MANGDESLNIINQLTGSFQDGNKRMGYFFR